ncbi:MAG: hypothetical protein Ct9H90mP3_8040 [Flammeovirgaceae bacterium]|nr:MAG: hypothetical protein Ct9H90mP3_8040 [Flammeovirgaceae bacterium]
MVGRKRLYSIAINLKPFWNFKHSNISPLNLVIKKRGNFFLSNVFEEFSSNPFNSKVLLW